MFDMCSWVLRLQRFKANLFEPPFGVFERLVEYEIPRTSWVVSVLEMVLGRFNVTMQV